MFCDELRVLDHKLTGRAALTDLEGQFKVVIVLRNGRGELSAMLREHVGPTLSVEAAATDQTFVRGALWEFERLLLEFPVREV